ncbi:proline-rich protein 15-like protein isoform X1 [Equus przewalskii]|uniref:Proline rich 15 like n=2 Tax=Equus TaxID=9789 RepID=A0A9L0SUZ4_HORSE|nr:proline-rich protein 15-like protein isoform X1 [Equus caballus]
MSGSDLGCSRGCNQAPESGKLRREAPVLPLAQTSLGTPSCWLGGPWRTLASGTCWAAAPTQLSWPEPCLAWHPGGTPTSASHPPGQLLHSAPSLRKVSPPSRSSRTTEGPTLGSGNAMTEVGWWKLTFLRKKKSTPKVLYEIPETYAQTEGGAETPRPDSEGPNGNFNTRLEKIVDKNTKGKHVKVSHSGRFKEKSKVRATLAENPNLFEEREGKGQ